VVGDYMGVHDAGTERYDINSTADYADIVAEPADYAQRGVGHVNHVNQAGPIGPPARTPSIPRSIPRTGNN